MAAYIESLQNLADQFMKLNGVGRKSSQRMAFSVLDMSGEEAAAFAAALNKLYTASKTESRAGFPHFRNTAGGETARGTTD